MVTISKLVTPNADTLITLMSVFKRFSGHLDGFHIDFWILREDSSVYLSLEASAYCLMVWVWD
jgi:hypothetical protein